MQLASSGLRFLKGGQARLFSVGGGLPSRSIHIPAYARLTPASQPTTVAEALLRHTRNAVSRFVAHLTAPSALRSPIHAHVAAGSRPIHVSSIRIPTIQERLSFPARQILSRPLSVPFLPRPPALPRHISQVGLGCARNFSTTRPIFQHLVENVPVYARAFSEVDWEIRIQEERERLRMERYKAKRAAKEIKKAKAPLRSIELNVIATPSASVVESEKYEKAELEHYFPESTMPEVTTHLLIPLVPTPTSRLPLPLHPPATYSAHPLLPLDVIASLHASHGTHALRVSTIFARLDTAQVFNEPGVYFEARGDASGLCTILEVRFEGWTANKVRGILGEAGTGWCVLDEVWRDQEYAETEAMDDALDALSVSGTASTHDLALSGLSDLNASWGPNSDGIDPARSFVLPTLDFSASFPAPMWSPVASGPPSAMSDLEFHNEWVQGSRPSSPGCFWSDEEVDTGSASDWFELPAAPSTTDRSFVFSSRFSERMDKSDGPHEELF